MFDPVIDLYAEAWRRLKLAGWRWARREIPRTLGVSHPAMREALLAIADLERPTPRRRLR